MSLQATLPRALPENPSVHNSHLNVCFQRASLRHLVFSPCGPWTCCPQRNVYPSFFLNNFVYLSIGYAGSLLPCGFFSSCSKWGLLSSCPWASHCCGFLKWSPGSSAQASVVVVCGLSSSSSWALKHRLRCSKACGFFLGQGSNPCPLHLQAGSLPSEPPGKPPGSELGAHVKK